MNEKEIDILEEMLRRMENGTLGCSGFIISETEVLEKAIKELRQ